MWDLESIIGKLEDKGLVTKLERTLSPLYEPTTHLIEAEKLGKALIFHVENFSWPCAGSVISRRDILYDVLGVKSDEDMYLRILSNPPENSWYTLRSFDECFREFSGNVESLPAIKFYKGDGGRYITTSIVVAKVPGLDTYNASVHRLMIVNSKGFAIRIVPRHLYRIYEDNRREGRETPVAVMIGASPITLLAASTSPPYGVFELSLYKNLAREPIEIAVTPNYNIPVDASSAVVIEGRLTLDQVFEGPFVDLLNLYDKRRLQPLLKVERIYVNRCRNPYFHVILPGGSEHKLFMGLPREALIWDAVRRAVPKVVKVRLTRASGCWLHAVISIEKNSEGDGKTAILAALGAHPSVKHVIVVDSDIDPDDVEDVEWAIATRFRADRDLIIVNRARGSTLDPSAEEGLISKMGLDATAPLKDRVKYVKPQPPSLGDG